MALVTIDARDKTPIYAQLERGLRAAMATSRLRPGDQLPTVRQLAVELRINANTVARVYADLERAGAIETRRGVGSFVTASPEKARPPREHEKRLRAFATRVLAEAGGRRIRRRRSHRGTQRSTGRQRNGRHGIGSSNARTHRASQWANLNVVAVAILLARSRSAAR